MTVFTLLKLFPFRPFLLLSKSALCVARVPLFSQVWTERHETPRCKTRGRHLKDEKARGDRRVRFRTAHISRPDVFKVTP